jgi:hypothetical protein
MAKRTKTVTKTPSSTTKVKTKTRGNKAITKTTVKVPKEKRIKGEMKKTRLKVRRPNKK